MVIEGLEIMPPFGTNTNTPTAIKGVVIGAWIRATLDHTFPGFADKMISEAVSKVALLSWQTAARLRNATCKFSCLCLYRLTTIALAEPNDSDAANTCYGAKRDKTAKALAYKVYGFATEGDKLWLHQKLAFLVSCLGTFRDVAGALLIGSHSTNYSMFEREGQ